MNSSASAAGPVSVQARPVRKREIFAWCLYDWANSAYSTIQITILMMYLTRVVFPGDAGAPSKAGTLVYGWGIGLTMLASAVLAPVLGAMADARASKRIWLALTTLPAAAAGIGMFFVPPERTGLVVALFIVANLGYELSQGFYNAFLPEIADEKSMNRVSAWGFALGYIGGGLLLLIAILISQYGQHLGMPAIPETATDAEKVAALAPRMQTALLIMGAWWAVFSLPMLVLVRDRAEPRARRESIVETAGGAFVQVVTTLRNVRVYRTLFTFLVAFLIYNDGVQTIITQAGVFAQEVLNVSMTELVMVVLMIQFAAMPGAMAMGWLAEHLGQKRALLLCLAIYILWLLAAFFINNRWQFWAMGVVLAMIMGGVQSVSRAIMGLLTPPSRSGEFFGFFNLSAKATSPVGPPLFTSILALTGSPRLAILSLLVFFILGGALVLRVDVKQGQREALRQE